MDAIVIKAYKPEKVNLQGYKRYFVLVKYRTSDGEEGHEELILNTLDEVKEVKEGYIFELKGEKR